MDIAFVYAGGRAIHRESVITGGAPSEFFYGAVQLESRGHNVLMHEVGRKAAARFGEHLAEALYRLRLTPTRTSGALLGELYDLCACLNEKDVVVATTTESGFGLGVLRTLGILRRPVVALHCGIANYELARRRRRINGMVLKRTWTQLFGEGELEPTLQMFGVPRDRIEVNQFGVDTDFWVPAGEEEEYVLSVGNDLRRDYELLLRTARESDKKMVIVTKRELGDELPPNVQLIRGGWHENMVTDADLRTLYQRARVVVVPLRDTPQPSGQSVCLQAMACAKPVVLTRTRGLWSPTTVVNGQNVLLVPPGDREALGGAIDRLWADAATRGEMGRRARETALTDGSIERFADRLELFCRHALEAESASVRVAAS